MKNFLLARHYHRHRGASGLGTRGDSKSITASFGSHGNHYPRATENHEIELAVPLFQAGQSAFMRLRSVAPVTALFSRAKYRHATACDDLGMIRIVSDLRATTMLGVPMGSDAIQENQWLSEKWGK